MSEELELRAKRAKPPFTAEEIQSLRGRVSQLRRYRSNYLRDQSDHNVDSVVKNAHLLHDYVNQLHDSAPWIFDLVEWALDVRDARESLEATRYRDAELWDEKTDDLCDEFDIIAPRMGDL